MGTEDGSVQAWGRGMGAVVQKLTANGQPLGVQETPQIWIRVMITGNSQNWIKVTESYRFVGHKSTFHKVTLKNAMDCTNMLLERYSSVWGRKYSTFPEEEPGRPPKEVRGASVPNGHAAALSPV